MNALELLKEDHEKVSALFEQAEATDNAKRKKPHRRRSASSPIQNNATATR